MRFRLNCLGVRSGDGTRGQREVVAGGRAVHVAVGDDVAGRGDRAHGEVRAVVWRENQTVGLERRQVRPV